MNLEQKIKDIPRLVDQEVKYDYACFKTEILYHFFAMVLLWSTSYLPEKVHLIKGICHMLFMITAIRYIITLFRQTFICVVFLFGRNTWRKLEKKRLLEKTYKFPENLLDVVLGKTNCWDRGKARCANFPDNPLINLIPCSNNIFLPKLNQYLFKLQYKAIIKPERLEPAKPS
jgi:hypothetical protein